jgi:hypothetical protein
MGPKTIVLISRGNTGTGYEIVKKIALTTPTRTTSGWEPGIWLEAKKLVKS